MSINTAHATNGVLLHATEFMMLYIDCMTLEINGEKLMPLYGLKSCRLYLTSHRMIFINKKIDNMLQSLSSPYVAMSDIELKEPRLLSKNYIEFKLQPQPGGHIHNELTCKMRLKWGSEKVLEPFLQFCVASAKENMVIQQLDIGVPAYDPLTSWFEQQPISYEPPASVKELLPEHEHFTEAEPNTIFNSGMMPPYVGIIVPGYREPVPKPCTRWPKVCCPEPKIVPKQRDFAAQVRLPHQCRIAGGLDLFQNNSCGCDKSVDPVADLKALLQENNNEPHDGISEKSVYSSSPSVYLFKPPTVHFNESKTKSKHKMKQKCNKFEDFNDAPDYADAYKVDDGVVLERRVVKPKA